jgi:hypothetical protein
MPSRMTRGFRHSYDEHKRRSQEAGFNSHLVKPVEAAALEKLLAELNSDKA